MHWKRTICGAIIVGITAMACARNNQGGGDTSRAADSMSAGRGQQGDLRAEVQRLEERLRSLAKADGCQTASGCKTVPVGERACGGPREHVVYCPLTTDEPALFAVVDSLRQAETRYNESTGAVSTCEYRLPPTPAVEGGRCVAAAP